MNRIVLLPVGRSAAGLVSLLLAALLGAALSSPAAAQRSSRDKIKTRMGEVQTEMATLDKKIERLREDLEGDRKKIAREHAACFDPKNQDEIGKLLAKALEGQCGPDRPDRKEPQEIVDSIGSDLLRTFGRTVKLASEKTLVDFVGFLMEEPADPDVVRAARLLSETFEAAFGKDFEKAWETLKTYAPAAAKLKSAQEERAALQREFEGLEDALTANIKGNHPRNMAPVPGAAAAVLGLAVEEIETLASQNDEDLSKAKFLALGSARVETRVADFLIDRYEVTHEAYWYFCIRTERAKDRWPGYWAPDPLTGKDEFRPLWSDGKIPEGWEDRPITYVSWDDALEYCEWTGCRLPTEDEWEVAARSGRVGFDGRYWPFGKEYSKHKANDAKANDIEARLKLIPPKGLNLPAVLPVGAMEESRSPLGIYDLTGNVAEWTSSRFVARETFKAVELAKHRFSKSDFDEEKMVIRGGHCDMSPLFASSVMRFAELPHVQLKFLGFRRARSAVPGRDVLGRLMRGGRLDARLQDFKLLPSEKKEDLPWPSIDVREGRFAAVEKFDWNEELGVPGQAHAVLIANRKMDDVASDKELERVADGDDDLKDSVLIGIIHTDVPIAEPKLAPGTWFVAFKKGRKFRDPETKKRVAIKDGFLFYPLRPNLEAVRIDAESNVIVSKNPGTTKLDAVITKEGDFDFLDCVFSHEIRRARGRGLETVLRLKVEKGLLDGYE